MDPYEAGGGKSGVDCGTVCATVNDDCERGADERDKVYRYRCLFTRFTLSTWTYDRRPSFGHSSLASKTINKPSKDRTGLSKILQTVIFFRFKS